MGCLWENSFFKTLIDHQVTVELKNDIQIRGTLKGVDQYLNIKLDDISVVEEIKYPHLVSVFITKPSLSILQSVRSLRVPVLVWSSFFAPGILVPSKGMKNRSRNKFVPTQNSGSFYMLYAALTLFFGIEL